MIGACITDPGSEECSTNALLEFILCVILGCFYNFIYPGWQIYRPLIHTPKGEFEPTQCGFADINPETDTDGRILYLTQDSEQRSCGSTDIKPERDTDGRILSKKQDSDQRKCGSANIEPETNTDVRILSKKQDSKQRSRGSTNIEPETNTDGRILCKIQDSNQRSRGSTDKEPETKYTDGRILCKIQDSKQRSRGSTDKEPETNTDGRILCALEETSDIQSNSTSTESTDDSIHVFLEYSTQKLVGSRSVKCVEVYKQTSLKTGKKLTGKSRSDAKNIVKRCDIAISVKDLNHIPLKKLILDLFCEYRFELAQLLNRVSYIIYLRKYYVSLKTVTNLPDIKSYKPRNSKSFSNGEAMKVSVSQKEEMLMSASVYEYREDKPRDPSFGGHVKKESNSTCLEKVSKSTSVEARSNSTCVGKGPNSSCMKNGFNSFDVHYVGFLAWNRKEMWLKLILVGPRENENLCEVISQTISSDPATLVWEGESDHCLLLSVLGVKVKLYFVTSSGSKDFFVFLEELKAKKGNFHYMIESELWKENVWAYVSLFYNIDKLPAICYPLSHEGPVNSVARDIGDENEKEMTYATQANEAENKESPLPTDGINDTSGCHGEEESTHSPEEEENHGKYLFEACLYCIQDTIESAVQSDVSLSNTRKTALMCAVSRKHTECLRAFSFEGADINEADHKGRTALILASMTEHCTSCLYFLIMNGASLDKADNEGLTALMHATRKCFLEYVVILVAAMTNDYSPESEIPKLGLMNGTLTYILRHIPVLGKDHPILNATDRQHKTALIHAVENEFIDCIQVFVKAGADVNKADFRGKSPLMIMLKEISNPLDQRQIGKEELEDLLVEEFFNCSLGHHLKTISILLEAGADINQADHQGNTPLIHAVRAQDIQCCHLLLLRGADVNMRNNEKRTAFMYAARNVNTDMMKTLMAFGAEINLQDNNQQTGLMIVIHIGRSMSRYFYSGRNTSIKAVKFLVENGADLSARDKNGETALVTGVKNGQSVQCLQLISDKQSIDLPDNDGMTALIHALKLKTEEDVIEYASILLEQGANPVIVPQFHYLLHPRPNSQQLESRFHMDFFLEHKDFELVRLIVSNGIVHSAIEANGVRYVAQPSLLNVALHAGHIEVATYLIATNYLMELDLKALRCLQVQCLSGQCTLKDQGIHLVEQATSQPWPLGKLSFVAVSSALGHGPRREERIRQTGLPVRLQEMLLFKSPVSRIPVNQWAEIKLRFDTVEHERWPLLYYWPIDVDENKIKDVF